MTLTISSCSIDHITHRVEQHLIKETDLCSSYDFKVESLNSVELKMKHGQLALRHISNGTYTTVQHNCN